MYLLGRPAFGLQYPAVSIDRTLHDVSKPTQTRLCSLIQADTCPVRGLRVRDFVEHTTSLNVLSSTLQHARRHVHQKPTFPAKESKHSAPRLNLDRDSPRATRPSSQPSFLNRTPHTAHCTLYLHLALRLQPIPSDSNPKLQHNSKPKKKNHPPKTRTMQTHKKSRDISLHYISILFFFLDTKMKEQDGFC